MKWNELLKGGNVDIVRKGYCCHALIQVKIRMTICVFDSAIAKLFMV